MVRDDSVSFSALPHEIMRDTSLSRDARLLYAILQGYAWQGGECRASHGTLAAEMGCSVRMLRVYLTELIDAGRATEHDSGYRRQKVYRLVSIGTVLPIETFNEKPASDWNGVNRKFPTRQSEISDTVNRKPASDSKKKTPEKKKLEEELATTLLGGADAPQPATAETLKAKRSGDRRTRCPDTFPLEDKHFAYGRDLGMSEARVRAETDKFLAHHRFKGTLGLDWYAGWQNWMRRAITYDAAPKTEQRNGRSDMPPPGAASKQKSKWTDPEIAARFRVKVLGGPTDGGQ